MKRMTIITRTLSGLAIAAALVACGSDDDGNGGNTGGSSTGATSSGGSSGGSTGGAAAGGTSSGGDTSSGGSATGGEGGSPGDHSAECVTYCQGWEETCEGENDGEFDYGDEESCLAACADFPSGAATGNTVQCRISHVDFAKNTSDLSHCGHAAAEPTEMCVD